MTATTEGWPTVCPAPKPAADEQKGPSAYDKHVAALADAYHRTVDTIMTARYGPGWDTRGDLPDEAYTTEVVFSRWLSDLLDHIDAVSAPASQALAR
ncbi:MAG: hypothetical protein QOI76_769 [Frankiales bacterium]|nr:hypothetical protein [Frankiales bacterium]